MVRAGLRPPEALGHEHLHLVTGHTDPPSGWARRRRCGHRNTSPPSLPWPPVTYKEICLSLHEERCPWAFAGQQLNRLYFGETSLSDPITAGETSWLAFAMGTKGPQLFPWQTPPPHRTLVWKAFPLSMLMAFQTFQCEMRGRL